MAQLTAHVNHPRQVCACKYYVRVGIWIVEKSLFICAKRISWGTGVNFYGRSGSAGTGGFTSASSQTAAAAADAKLDGIYNLLTLQNQHMLVLQEQGQQALEEVGHLGNRVGYLESKMEQIEGKQQAELWKYSQAPAFASFTLCEFVV